MGFPGGSDGKESTCNVVDLSSIPVSGRSLGEGNSNPLQYSCLENSIDRGAWRAIVHGVTVLDTTECTHTHTHARTHARAQVITRQNEHSSIPSLCQALG